MADSVEVRDGLSDEFSGGSGVGGGIRGGGSGNMSGIVSCDISQFCSGNAAKCMQKGTRRKCKCNPGWGGFDCSTSETPDAEVGSYAEESTSSFGNGLAAVPVAPDVNSNADVESLTLEDATITDSLPEGGREEHIDPGSVHTKTIDDDGNNENYHSSADSSTLMESVSGTSLHIQLKALGGVLGIALLCLVAFCVKRRCSSKSPAANDFSSRGTSGSSPQKGEEEEEQWEDWDDQEQGQQEQAPMLQPKEPQPSSAPPPPPLPSRSAPSPTSLPPPSLNVRGNAPESESRSARNPSSSLGSLRKAPAKKSKASTLNDYPPLVPENADSLFADMGISAKPTFVKPPPEPKSRKLADLGSEMGGESPSWGDGDDDQLDDI